MAILRFDAVDDYLKWTALAAALQNVPTGPYTFLTGVRHNSLSGYQGYGYLLSGSGVGIVQAGFSKHSGGDIFVDTDDPSSAIGIDPAVGTDYLYLVSMPAPTATPTFSRQVKGAAMAHEAGNSTMIAQLVAAMLQIGSWQNGDLLNGWKAVFAIWNVALSQAQREACGANWRTSDIYSAHPIPPLVLLEFNVAAGSLVNLGTAAISGAAHVGTTLDSGQTFGGWSFDGIGGSVPDTNNFFNFI